VQDHETMQVTVTGRHIDVGDALRTHVEAGLEGAVAKYFDNALDALVTFTKTGAFFHADISVRVGRGINVRGAAEADDPYIAFNGAAEHIAKRLRRHKRRLRDHHADAPRIVESFMAQQYILSHDEVPADDEAGSAGAADGGDAVVIAELETAVETLTVEEAVMRMDLEDAPALMFRNAAHGGLNMIYRRADGNIGWLDPRGNREAGR